MSEAGVKKYVIRLSNDERSALEALISKGKHPAATIVRARIVLKADVSEAGEGWSTEPNSALIVIEGPYRERANFTHNKWSNERRNQENPGNLRPQPYGLTPPNQIVIVCLAGERRGVAIVNRIEPKPLVPDSNDHTVFTIVAAPYHVAVPKGPERISVLNRSPLMPSSNRHDHFPALSRAPFRTLVRTRTQLTLVLCRLNVRPEKDPSRTPQKRIPSPAARATFSARQSLVPRPYDPHAMSAAMPISDMSTVISVVAGRSSHFGASR
jgi:hypothetical protein